MGSRPILIYADTSVFGGVFDEEFRPASGAFFHAVRSGCFSLCTSAIVHDEIEAAPEDVRVFFDEILPLATLLDIDEEALNLRSAYLAEGIVGAESSVDALHVALATVSRCKVVVSWNFKHIVHFQKIPLYNAVNVLQGYGNIAIHSPTEVIPYEGEGV